MNTKPGFKTTEFWITVGTWLGGAGAVVGLPEEHWIIKVAAVAASIIQSVAYTYARVKLKE